MDRELAANSILSHYRIVSKIGAGGMGEVYLAEDTKLDRQVALKILPHEFAEDNDRMNRFVREAKSASALNQPNIITIYEISETDGIHFIASEYIQGETLHTRLEQTPLDLKTTLDIAIQVASALNAAHKAGIIHRDIKPENVMIRPDGLLKILDFGIAKLSARRTEALDEEAATALKQQGTSPGTIIGTASYMSPEQARGKDVSTQSDIFSFGIVLYDFPLVTSGFCWSYYAKGDLDRAIPACRKTRELVPDAYNTGYLGLVLGRAGQREEARMLLAELKNQSSRREIPSMAFAFAYMGLDQKDEAMAMLEKEVEERGYWSSSFASQPELDEFRSDPRFKELLRRMNFPH